MDLAPAQGDILHFVKAGASGFILKDASEDDFVTTIRSVKSHVHNIMENLALHTRLEVANYTFTDGTLAKEIAKSISIINR